MYEIKILSNNEFDSLPESITRGSNITGSLGFANPFIKKAYVRETGIHDLNKFLVNHELEELLSSSSTHEDENGIRHKKFKDFFEPIISIISSFIPGASQILGGIEASANRTNAKEIRGDQAAMAAQQQASQPSFVMPTQPQASGSQSSPSGGFAPGQTGGSGMSGSASVAPSMQGGGIGSLGGSGMGGSLGNLSMLSNFSPNVMRPEQMQGYYAGREPFRGQQQQELRF